MRGILRLRIILEASIISLFFIQALRYLVGGLYSRLSSATIFPAIDPATIDPTLPGLVAPDSATSEVILLIYMIALPILAVFVGRFRALFVIAAIVTAFGRVALNLPDDGINATAATAIAVGGGLLYIAMVIRQRAHILPYLFVIGFAADQLFRTFGDTLDPSWSTGYLGVQIVLSIAVVVLAIVNVVRPVRDSPNESQGLMPFWAGLGLGALLFLELALLATPNALARRSGSDYTLLVPLVIVATLLPLVPFVREQARRFIGLFDSSLRGWAWMLLVALLVVFGTRFQGLFAGIALVIAQFSVSMMWFWLARQQAEKERNLSGLWLVFSVLTFAMLVIFDLFTYEYAFVRDFARPLTFLNDIIPPLIRGFRGLGLVVLLLAVFLAALPMVQTRRRIPWRGGPTIQSAIAIILIAGAAGLGTIFAQPPVISIVRNPETIRVATYNIHAGYNEFFHYDIEGIARTINFSGANVVLLQEVEAGRLTSFGVDQPLWLARRLPQLRTDTIGFDVRFYPTNENLQGLAVLSNIEIAEAQGFQLTSRGNQTGVQVVRLQPDDGQITVYNTWLGLLLADIGERTIGEQEQDQERQVTEIFTLIQANGFSGRIVLGGTFNNIPDSDLIRQISTAGFDDSFAGEALTTSATFWQTNRRARLDYIFTRNLPKQAALVLDNNASDHRLAVVEVLVTR